ncbi:MAG: hypothetical protein ACRYFZ_07325 [Janthinobacterium lividum]
MKLAADTPALDFTALKKVESAHDVDYLAGQLARRRAHFAFLFQRYQDLLTLDDEGYEVSITLTSATKTVTLSRAEGEDSFDMTALYEKHGNHMAALQAEILDLLENKQDGSHKDFGLWEGTGAPDMRQVVALCMPQSTTPAPADSPAPTTPDAKAA